jgi:DNA-binding NarL/FixJ family response regulator
MVAADSMALGQIDVFIVAAIRLYREGLRLALERTTHIRAVGMAATADELTSCLLELRPTVLLDVVLPAPAPRPPCRRPGRVA